jgi:hypothetical protein
MSLVWSVSLSLFVNPAVASHRLLLGKGLVTGAVFGLVYYALGRLERRFIFTDYIHATR